MTGGNLPTRHTWLLRLILVAVMVPLAVLAPPRGGGEHLRSPGTRVLMVLPFVAIAVLVVWWWERRERRR